MNFRHGFKKNIFFVFLSLFIFLLFFIFASGKQKYSLQEALKVIGVLEIIRIEQNKEDAGPLRKTVITESELNSYIAYRIDTEREKIMKELRLKLFKANKIEGKIFFDLTAQDVPKILRSQMTFYFEAKLQVEKGRAKLKVKKLYLDKQRVPSLILDSIIYISARIENLEVSSISDWYELPYGIKNIETYPGQAVIFY